MGASLSALSVVGEETHSWTLVQQRPQYCKKLSPHMVGCRTEKSISGEGFGEDIALELGLPDRVQDCEEEHSLLRKSKNIAPTSYTFSANKTVNFSRAETFSIFHNVVEPRAKSQNSPPLYRGED